MLTLLASRSRFALPVLGECGKTRQTAADDDKDDGDEDGDAALGLEEGEAPREL
jgi:hypothetical protein